MFIFDTILILKSTIFNHLILCCLKIQISHDMKSNYLEDFLILELNFNFKLKFYLKKAYFINLNLCLFFVNSIDLLLKYFSFAKFILSLFEFKECVNFQERSAHLNFILFGFVDFFDYSTMPNHSIIRVEAFIIAVEVEEEDAKKLQKDEALIHLNYYQVVDLELKDLIFLCDNQSSSLLFNLINWVYKINNYLKETYYFIIKEYLIIIGKEIHLIDCYSC